MNENGINEFKEIPEFCAYEINRKGIIRNIRRGNIVKLRENDQGCKYVQLYRDGKQFSRIVDRLVHETFGDVIFIRKRRNL